VKLNWKNLSSATIAGALVLTAAAAVAFSQGPQGPPRGGGFRGVRDRAMVWDRSPATLI